MVLRSMKTLRVLVPAIGLVMGTAVYAANTSDSPNNAAQQNSASAQQNQQGRTAGSMRASKLIGMPVRNAQGEDLGKVQDLVIDVNNGDVYYAVLSFGGWMSMGDKLFAYPLRVFGLADNANQLVLNIDKQKLKDAPGFEANRWPEWGRDRYRAEVDRYYGDKLTLQPRPNTVLRRASTLNDADVIDASGNDVGDVEDIVVDMRNGSVQYVVVDFDDDWAHNDRLTQLPLAAFRPSRSEQDKLVLRVNQQQVATAPSFDENNWPNLNDRNAQANVNRWFSDLGVDTTAAGDRNPPQRPQQ
ncbi:MAG TPA: PRC-barrel domain-containing protein [Burkholderiales bacterium]|nr:PRC-barrel domain-containing protein [Burkholderiales bacterium]